MICKMKQIMHCLLLFLTCICHSSWTTDSGCGNDQLRSGTSNSGDQLFISHPGYYTKNSLPKHDCKWILRPPNMNYYAIMNLTDFGDLHCSASLDVMIALENEQSSPIWKPCSEFAKRDALMGIPWYVAGRPGMDLIITYRNVDNNTDFTGFAFNYGFRGKKKLQNTWIDFCLRSKLFFS